jgi:hypothetical protein
MKWHNARQQIAPEDAERYLANRRKRYHADPEAARQRMKEWRAKNPEKQKAIEQRRHERHYEKRNARSRAAHHADKERRNAKRLQWHEEHREYANGERKMRYQKTREKDPWVLLLRIAKFRAKKKKVSFSLTDEWARERWTGACEITGIPFQLAKNNGNFYSPSIDRIEASAGYTPDNSRFVLFAVNTLKGRGSDEDMILVARAICEYANKINSLSHQEFPPTLYAKKPDDDFAQITS